MGNLSSSQGLCCCCVKHNEAEHAPLLHVRHTPIEAPPPLERKDNKKIDAELEKKLSAAWKQRMQVMQEIISSERSYVSDLSNLVLVFIQPLRNPSVQHACKLSDKQVAAMFCNIESIAKLHQVMLESLETVTAGLPSPLSEHQQADSISSLATTTSSLSSGDSIESCTPSILTPASVSTASLSSPQHTLTTASVTALNRSPKWFSPPEPVHVLATAASVNKDSNIAGVFIQYGDLLRNYYRDYVASYDHCLQTVEQLRFNPKFTQFLNDQRKDRRCRQLDLSSFLIMPIQRIPRYELLLCDLQRKTDPLEQRVSVNERTLLSQAVELMHSIAVGVNERRRDIESTVNILEVQRRIKPKYLSKIGSLLRPGRVVVRQGRIPLQSSLSRNADVPKVQEVILFNDAFIWMSPSQDRFKGMVDLLSVQLELCPTLSIRSTLTPPPLRTTQRRTSLGNLLSRKSKQDDLEAQDECSSTYAFSFKMTGFDKVSDSNVSVQCFFLEEKGFLDWKNDFEDSIRCSKDAALERNSSTRHRPSQARVSLHEYEKLTRQLSVTQIRKQHKIAVTDEAPQNDSMISQQQTVSVSAVNQPPYVADTLHVEPLDDDDDDDHSWSDVAAEDTTGTSVLDSHDKQQLLRMLEEEEESEEKGRKRTQRRERAAARRTYTGTADQ